MRVSFLLALILSTFSGYTQQQVWDVTFTEIQISQNKHHYSDNVDAKNNQLLSLATVEAWKTQQSKFNDLVNNIDKWVKNGFIVLSDFGTAYEVYTKMKDLISLQGKSFDLIYKHPWAIPIFVSREKSVITEAEGLVALIYMLVVTEGPINKMRVAERRLLYQELRDQLQLLLRHSKGLYYRIQSIDLQEIYKSVKPIQWLNNDAQLVNNVIKDFKF